MAFSIPSKHRLLGFACLCVALSGCAAPGLSGASPWNGNPFAGLGRFMKGANKGPEATPDLNISYAKLQEESGNYSEARKRYSLALQQDPKSAEAVLGLARLDYLAHRIDESESQFKKAVKLAPNSPVTLTALGGFYAEQQRWDEAIEVLSRTLEVAPDEKVYRCQLAIVLAKAGRLDDAMQYFSESVGIAEGHYNIGRILYDQGKIAQSEKQFLLAVTKNPRLDEAQFWLDEVRREQDAQTVLSAARTSPGSGPAADPRLMQASAASMPGAPNVTRQTSNGGSVSTSPASSTIVRSAPASALVQQVGSQMQSAPTNNPGPSPQQLEQMRNQQNGNFPQF